uniref:non-specific serine/threonine protein kinase n=1 Tax=Populus alba TaxID=43335 RepID=A0A4U5QQE8_POPAL|nr:putative receptor-like protein kinase [Populus alba]
MRLVPTRDLFVCRFWPIPSSIFLLSLLTFSVASLQQPTTAAAPSTAIHPPTAITLKHHRSLFDHRFAIPLTASLLLLLLLVIVMGCFLGLRFRHKRLAKKVDAASNGSDDLDSIKEKDSDHGTHGRVRKYNWSEIEKLSMNFSQIVGSGGFSTVYLGHLPDSNLGAIKIHCPSDYLNRVFKQELDILLQLEHDNIVKLLGYCDVQDEGALVFEYVSNGTLQDKLHGGEREIKKSSSSSDIIASDNECKAMKVAEMVDPRLGEDFKVKEVKVMLSLAALCLGQSPSLRPSAAQILHTIKENIASISFISTQKKDLSN